MMLTYPTLMNLSLPFVPYFPSFLLIEWRLIGEALRKYTAIKAELDPPRTSHNPDNLLSCDGDHGGMQRIVLRYCREMATDIRNHSDLCMQFQQAAAMAGLPISEGRRAILLAPPLPVEATSEAEYALIELVRPADPSEVARLLNRFLPDGLHIERAWIAQPGSPDENPGAMDEAVYQVRWQSQAPAAVAIAAAIERFLSASEISFTRAREKKTQVLNARALVQDIALCADAAGMVYLRMTVSVGPLGSLRPAEVLQVLGFPPAPGDIHVHRVALQRSIWRHPSPARRAHRWRKV